MKETSESASKGKNVTCSDCAIVQNEPDMRNEYFSKLINEEFQYIQPCMWTRFYAKNLIKLI